MISLYKFPDVFDEHAKNEAACVQALHHLIAKADSEIDNLKDELAVVQCQRKWAESGEHTNLFEVCCDAFQQRIDSITSNIQRLRNGVDTVSDIQRPSEKICDIIDALIKPNFTELDEQSQEGDVNSEKAQTVSCGLVNICTDVRRQTTTLESSMESEKQTPVLDKLDKPTQTLSEESCLDAARYTTTDMTEVISMDLTDAKVFGQIENAEHVSKEKTVFSKKIEPVTSQCPFQVSNDEGNTKPSGSQCGEIEIESPTLVAKTEAIVKVEQNDPDTSIEITYVRKKSDNDSKIQCDSAVKDDLMAVENQSQSVSDLEITYGRKKSDHDTDIQCDFAVEDHLMTLENQSQSISDLEITYGRKKSDHDSNIRRDSAVQSHLMALENESQSISDLAITYGRKKSDDDTNIIQHDSAVVGDLMSLENQSQSSSDLEITYGRKKSDDDTTIKHDSAVVGHLMTLENQPQSISDLEITYGRKRPSLSIILKPPGKKVRKKILDDVRAITSSQTLVPKKTVTKRKYSSIESPLSTGIDKSFRFLPESNWERKLVTEENAGLNVPLQVSQAKKRQPKEAKVDFPDILSSEVNVPEGSLDTERSMSSNSSSRITVRLPSPNPVEVKETVTEIPEFDLESLKERRSEPYFLRNLTMLQLKKIAKLLNLRGISKVKKDKLIEELLKCLGTL